MFKQLGRVFSLTAAFLVIGFGKADAQSILVEKSVNGDAFTLLPSIPTVGGLATFTITITDTDASVVYRITDPDIDPNDSIGTLTLNGDIGVGEVRVLFARGVLLSSDVYPTLASQTLLAGLLHLGTPGQPVIVYATNDLRDRTRVAAAVTGDVLGDLTAGRITRVQALGVTVNNTLTGGTISGAITSTQEDIPTIWSSLNGTFAIGHIVAGRVLSGDVTAQQPASFNANIPGSDGFDEQLPNGSLYQHTASIDTIQVAPTLSTGVTGIALSADIHAPAGRIQSVQTLAPIMPRADRGRRPQFKAGNGVWSVTAFPSGSVTPADVDFNVDIVANAIAGSRFTRPSSGFGAEATREQAMRRLVTGGDFTGRIITENLA